MEQYKVCNPHCRGPPCCLCVNWSTYEPRSIPSLPPFVVSPSFALSLLHDFFSFLWSSVLLFQVSLSTVVPKMGGSEVMLCLPRSLTMSPWFVIYTLVGIGLSHLGCVATRGNGWGEDETEQQLKPEVASSRFCALALFIVSKETLQLAILAVSADRNYWLFSLFEIETQIKNLSAVRFYVDSWKNLTGITSSDCLLSCWLFISSGHLFCEH